MKRNVTKYDKYLERRKACVLESSGVLEEKNEINFKM